MLALNDSVPLVPGYGAPRSPIFAGRLPVDSATRGVELFYIFTSVLPTAHFGPPSDVPIITWFQGGGGASPPWGNQTGPFALGGYAGGGPSTFGMLCEKMGPFTTPDNSSGAWVLRDNPYTWNAHAHLLFIDQPAGVGLSSFSADANGFVADGAALGRDVGLALEVFFARHPELQANPLYLFGESYAGHYVPYIAHYILSDAVPRLRGQLAGVGLGDVCPGEEHSLSLSPLLHGLGYLDDAQLAQARALGARCKVDLAAQDWAAAFKSCEALEVFKGLSSGGIHDQDSRVYANYSSLAQLVNVDGATSEGRWQELATAWLDDSRTRAALHVGGVNRSSAANQRNTTRGLWDGYDNARSTIALWPQLVSSLRVLVYNGNFDVSCNWKGTEAILSTLGNWFADADVGRAYAAAFGAKEKRWMTLGSQMAGYWRHVAPPEIAPGSLTQVVVQGAGHLAPRDQPARVTAMVGRWLADTSATSLCDERHGVCRASDVALGSLGSRCALMYNCSGHGRCTDEARCACDDGWAGTDCAQGASALRAGAATFVVAPGGWQFHRASTPLSVALALNRTAAPPPPLPRFDAASAEGLVAYLAPPGGRWPPDALADDLAATFVHAWRFPAAAATPGAVQLQLRAGDVLGVKNHRAHAHAPPRAYTLTATGFELSDDTASRDALTQHVTLSAANWLPA